MDASISLGLATVASRILFHHETIFPKYSTSTHQKKLLREEIDTYPFYEFERRIFSNMSRNHLLKLDIEGMLMFVFVPRSKWPNIKLTTDLKKGSRVVFRTQDRYFYKNDITSRKKTYY